MLDSSNSLIVTNNHILRAEQLIKTMSDVNGAYSISFQGNGEVSMYVVDIQGNSALVKTKAVPSKVDVILPRSASVSGQCYNGQKPMANTIIEAVYLSENKAFRYIHKTKTRQDGRFAFDTLMPGRYWIQVVQDVPPMNEGDTQKPANGRQPCENDERHGHDFWRFMHMNGWIDSGFSMKSHEHQPEHIKRRQKRGGYSHSPQDDVAVYQRVIQHLILTEKTR